MYVTFFMFYVFNQEEEDEAPHVGNVNGGGKACASQWGAVNGDSEWSFVYLFDEVIYLGNQSCKGFVKVICYYTGL